MKIYSPDALKGKNILVTGASTGIGKAIAILLAECSASVVLASRNEERLREVCELLPGVGHSYCPVDMRNAESMAVLVDTLPKLDGIVYNAGVLQWATCRSVSTELIQTTMETNFQGVVEMQSMIMHRKKINKGASLVFMSSEAACRQSVGQCIYSASKAALLAYSKTLALELASKKIRVNSVLPAMVNTSIIDNGMVDAEQISRIVENYPLRRIGEPEDVAQLVAYLLSDASSWMTGSSLVIDGGASLM